jgi:hypothetical protein
MKAPLIAASLMMLTVAALPAPAEATYTGACVSATWHWNFQDFDGNEQRVTLSDSSGRVSTDSELLHNSCAGVITGPGCSPNFACIDEALLWSGHFDGTWVGSCALMTVFTDNGFVFEISPATGTVVGNFGLLWWGAGVFVSDTLNPCDMPGGQSIMAFGGAF